jgi:hypothetical protein
LSSPETVFFAVPGEHENTQKPIRMLERAGHAKDEAREMV